MMRKREKERQHAEELMRRSDDGGSGVNSVNSDKKNMVFPSNAVCVCVTEQELETELHKNHHTLF